PRRVLRAVPAPGAGAHRGRRGAVDVAAVDPAGARGRHRRARGRSRRVPAAAGHRFGRGRLADDAAARARAGGGRRGHAGVARDPRLARRASRRRGDGRGRRADRLPPLTYPPIGRCRGRRPRDVPTARAADAGGMTDAPSAPAVLVEGLRKAYGATVAVDDVSLAVEHGEVLGILGPNGAGKTTTVESIAGLRTGDAGRIRVHGLDPWTQR